MKILKRKSKTLGLEMYRLPKVGFALVEDGSEGECFESWVSTPSRLRTVPIQPIAEQIEGMEMFQPPKHWWDLKIERPSIYHEMGWMGLWSVESARRVDSGQNCYFNPETVGWVGSPHFLFIYFIVNINTYF